MILDRAWAYSAVDRPRRQQRTLMGALITIDVHARDVVRFMVKSGVCSVSDFEWTKQLRYYWEVRESTCLRCMEILQY